MIVFAQFCFELPDHALVTPADRCRTPAGLLLFDLGQRAPKPFNLRHGSFSLCVVFNIVMRPDYTHHSARSPPHDRAERTPEKCALPPPVSPDGIRNPLHGPFKSHRRQGVNPKRSQPPLTWPDDRRAAARPSPDGTAESSQPHGRRYELHCRHFCCHRI